MCLGRRKARCCAPMRRGRDPALRLQSFAAPPEQTPDLRSRPGPASPSMVRSGQGFDSVRELLGPLADSTTRRSRRRSRQPPPRPSLGEGLSRPPRRGSLGPLRQRTHVLVVPRGQVRHGAHIEPGGVDKDVLVIETGDMNEEIDARQARGQTKAPIPRDPSAAAMSLLTRAAPRGAQFHSPVEDDHPQARGRADARRADDCAAMLRSY
jgi:hypothetical protein